MNWKGTCETCKYAVRDLEEGFTLVHVRRCHRFPPNISVIKKSHEPVRTFTYFPEVTDIDFCAEYKQSIRMKDKL